LTDTISPDEIAFYYHGFLRVLRRYRYMTFLGWLIVAVGFISILLGWKLGFPHGLIDISLSVVTILAGILVVQQAVTALDAYIDVPFRKSETLNPHLVEIHDLMTSVNGGGWWEANAAIRTLETMAEKLGESTDPPS
jgi:hypothetical protein